MATRFAGDFFGFSLIEPEREASRLLDYYPELRRMTKQTANGKASTEEGGARLYGGAKAVPVFTSFKTFEKPEGSTFQASPVFAGFKTFNQPTTK